MKAICRSCSNLKKSYHVLIKNQWWQGIETQSKLSWEKEIHYKDTTDIITDVWAIKYSQATSDWSYNWRAGRRKGKEDTLLGWCQVWCQLILLEWVGDTLSEHYRGSMHLKQQEYHCHTPSWRNISASQHQATWALTCVLVYERSCSSNILSSIWCSQHSRFWAFS